MGTLKHTENKMLEAIQNRIKEYEKQVDGTFTDKIFKCKIEELEWCLSLLQSTQKSTQNKDKATQKTTQDFLSSKFTQKDTQSIRECVKDLDYCVIEDFIKYRIKIKKPFKTARGVIAFINKLKEAKEQGYNEKQIVDIVMENEWQNFELEWIIKKLPKVKSNLSEFGFNSHQGLLQ